jgi:hypothetical protein
MAILDLVSQLSFVTVATTGLLTVKTPFPPTSTSPEARLVLTKTLQLVAYFVGQTIYRLYFHPLAKFPGPTLNAISVVRPLFDLEP